jgi:putative heme-binding domain-containing protein
MNPLRLLTLALLSATLSLPLLAAERKLELQDGDRVLLIGDVLIERENNYGFLESRMRREFPGRNFAVRNLGYSGDSPLGASRASFDPVAKGAESLKEQLAVVKPTVAILGYGMAASLEDLTYRQNDPVLNPDPARYGLDHSPAKFRADLLALMDLITQANPGGQVRFVFVGPIRHEDMRATRPGLPDPAEHNALLTEYEKVIEELATEKQAPFIRGEWQKSAGIDLPQGTENGIHLSPRGYRALAESMAVQLGWKADAANWDAETPEQRTLRDAILRKNSLFFHRSRPANYTYIFGFRKGEQGRNAVEIPKFDPLIDKAEANVIGISAGKPSTLPPEPPSETKLPILPPLPPTEFTLDAGLQMTLFAENPLLEKPVGMNWDTSGRLWVATSNTYPQVNPDDLAAQMEGNSSKFGPSTGNDRIILMEDTNRDGIADVSRIVADRLLIPCGVAPDNFGGCFVGASTELLHLTQPGESGLLEERRIVLSGFGTEDTHHIIHGLHWGIDGRLYFQQTIYIHSHIETPWGLVRANSGVAFAYDPQTERLEVHSKGLVNCWGQQEDAAGQTFLTSGADGNGISWAFPGAVLPPSEGARRTITSISPGSYPKFCGLEIVNSPLFGPEWQGNALTNDFRAHRIVRFGFTDLSVSPNLDERKSGYVTQVLPDIARTGDSAFRPIALKMGPDGAIYIADWTNPIINHGEVDFRDPRRDKQRGRIWRIAPANAKGLDWQPVAGKPVPDLLASLLSPNRWEFEQARRELAKVPVADLQKALATWVKDEVTRRHAAWLLSGRTADTTHLVAMLNPQQFDETSVQVALRELGKSHGTRGVTDISAIAPWIDAKHNPRVRLEAFRALARIRTFESADLVLRSLPSNPADSYLDFAAWTSVNELARPWLEELGAHPEKIAGREDQVNLLSSIADPVVTGPYIQRLFADRTIDAAGSGPWIELIGKAGGVPELSSLYATFIKEGALEPAARTRVAQALVDAAKSRNLRPQGDLGAIGSLLQSTDRPLLLSGIRLIGEWRQGQFVPALATFAAHEKDAGLRAEALAALRLIGGQPTVDALQKLVAESSPADVRRDALIPLSIHAPNEAIKTLPSVLKQTADQAASLKLWQQLFQHGPFAAALAKDFPKDLTATAYADALQAAKGMGRSGNALVASLTPLVGGAGAPRDFPAEVAALVKAVQAGADPVDGELVYRRSGCVACHAIGGVGGNFGPDFSSMGASAPLDYIIDSTINPASKVKEGYHGFAFTLKDGTIMNGIPARETATEVIIRPAPGAEIPIIKANIVKRENIGSLMPPGFVDALDAKSKNNLFAFLGQIGRPGPFDASKANVARMWIFSTTAPDATTPRENPVYMITLVNGDLPKAEIPDKPYAYARFSNATPTKQPLILTGAKAAWLDGKPLTLNEGRFETPIPAGEHILTVTPDRATPLKAQCDDVTFLDIK